LVTMFVVVGAGVFATIAVAQKARARVPLRLHLH